MTTNGSGTRDGSERLHWSVDAGAQSHSLDLLPNVVGRSVSVELDGHPLARLTKPTPQRPWREIELTIDGQTFAVGLTWHVPVMRTDVFLNGRSIRDGRTVDEARRAAPTALRDYDVWMGGLFRSSVPRRAPLLPRWLAAVCLLSIVAVAIVFRWEPRPSGALAGIVLGAALICLFLVWMRSWLEVAGRTHAYLLSRPDLGDPRRVAGFFGVFVGYAILSVVVAAGLLWLLSR